MSLLKAFLIFTLFIASCHARPRPQPGKPFKFKADKELFDEKMGKNSEGADKPTDGLSDNQDETADAILGSRSKDASEGEAKPLMADEVVGPGTAEEETPAEAEEQGNKDASAEEDKPAEVEGPSEEDTSAPQKETEGIEGSNSAESGDGPANEANEETTGDGTISGEGVGSKSSTE